MQLYVFQWTFYWRVARRGLRTVRVSALSTEFRGALTIVSRDILSQVYGKQVRNCKWRVAILECSLNSRNFLISKFVRI